MCRVNCKIGSSIFYVCSWSSLIFVFVFVFNNMPQCDEGKGTFFLSARCIAYSVSCRVKPVKIVFDDSAKYPCCREWKQVQLWTVKNNTNVVIPLPLKWIAEDENFTFCYSICLIKERQSKREWRNNFSKCYQKW